MASIYALMVVLQFHIMIVYCLYMSAIHVFFLKKALSLVIQLLVGPNSIWKDVWSMTHILLP